MFAEVKEMLPNPISGDDYDAQIILWIEAGVQELTSTTEIRLDGTVDISREPVLDENDNVTGWKIVDNSDIDDKLVFAVLALYVCMNIGNPPNYSNLLGAFNSLKGSMQRSSKYNGGGRT